MNDGQATIPHTVVGLFHTWNEAERAVAELRSAGFRAEDIGLVGKDEGDQARAETGGEAAEVAAAGAAIGAGTAALVSLGVSFGVIPVVGPILAVGPLAAALLSAAGGMAAGGLLGVLVGLGVPEYEAKYYESEVHSGRFLVTVKAESRSPEAWSILHRWGAYNHGTAAAPVEAAAGFPTRGGS